MTDETENLPTEEKELDFEEKLIEILVTVAFPFLVSLISFGAIVLAFAQWKLY
ncbi:MAG: hypothetical protein ACLFN5_02545 [bacterium]